MRFWFLVSLVLFVGLMPIAANACTFNYPFVVVGDPPAGMTDPGEIESWEEEQREQHWADSAVTIEDEYQRQRRSREAEARTLARSLPAPRLASDLAISMVPPVLPQLDNQDSCGTLTEAEFPDEAGYESYEGLLLERGLIDELQMRLPAIRRIGSREHHRALAACTPEAVHRVADMLLHRFSREELANVWQGIHRLDFNRTELDLAWRPNGHAGPKKGRLLAFSSERSGRLAPARMLSTNYNVTWLYRGTQVYEWQREQAEELREFLSNDPTAIQIVDAISDELEGGITETCPIAAVEIGRVESELREEIEARLSRGRSSR